MLESFRGLYTKTESWFTIKYAAQILFAIVFGLVTFYGLPTYEGTTPEEIYKVNLSNALRGLLAVCGVFIGYSLLKPYVGPFYKPHEGLWRAVAAIATIYLLGLVFLLFQNPTFGRSLFAFIDPVLNRPLARKEHTFDDQCELNWENFVDNFDHYYLSHLLGWFVLTFMIRDRFVVHSWATLDEIVELSWQHILPHLRECWWDHLLIDMLLSNTVGIELAFLVIRFLGLNKYDWLGTTGAKSWREWKVFTCHRHFGFLMAFYGFVVARFLGMFFLMNALFLPPRHFICVLRVIGWAFFSFLPFREIYEDIRTWYTPERKTCKIEGNYRWLGMSIIYMECLVSYKYRHGTGHMNEDAPTPIHIVILWAIAIVCNLSFYLYLRCKKDHTRKFKDLPSSSSNIEANPPKLKHQ